MKLKREQIDKIVETLISSGWIKNEFDEFKDPKTGNCYRIRNAWNIYQGNLNDNKTD
jgi:hypothetical protein